MRAQPDSSLDLVLDPALELAIRGEWSALAEAGLSSLGAHTSASNAPHITAIARPSLPIPEVGAITLPVVLGTPVLLGDGERRVLARAVVPGRELLELHALLHRLVGPGADAAHTAIATWTPHVTLARRLRLADLPRAMSLIDAGELEGAVVGIRHWDPATATVTVLD